MKLQPLLPPDFSNPFQYNAALFEPDRSTAIDIWYAHSTVATVVEKDGHFLLVYERSNGELVFNQPAGHLEPGESLVAAAVRETLEETGWLVEITGLLSISLYTAPATGVTYHRTCFVANPLQHFPARELDPEILAVEWLSREQMQARRHEMRSPLVIAAVERFVNGQIYPLSVLDETARA